MPDKVGIIGLSFGATVAFYLACESTIIKVNNWIQVLDHLFEVCLNCVLPIHSASLLYLYQWSSYLSTWDEAQ